MSVTMSVAHSSVETLPHAVFLRRVAGERGATAPEGRLGQGAFLVLRLIDLLARRDDPLHPDAFRYQWTATDRLCRELALHLPETAHLHGLVRDTALAHRFDDVRLVAPGLLAYGYYLECELRLEESLDVLATLRRVDGERLGSSDRVALRLRVARVNRKLNRFDAAEEAYFEAGTLATAAGDTYSHFLSRIGRGNSLIGRGNLEEA